MARRGSIKDVKEATIDQDTLLQIMEQLDKDGDGTVTKDEFKVPWMKLFPKLTATDFDVAWEKIDLDQSGTLSLNELATHYGFNLSPNAQRTGAGDADMTDEQILEALQMATTLADMQAEQDQRKKEKEEEAKKKAEEEEAAKQAANEPKGRRGSVRRSSGSGGSGSDGLRRASVGAAGGAQDRERKKSLSGVATIKMPAKVTQSVDDPDIQFMQMCELGDKDAILAALKKTGDAEQRVRMEDDKGEMPIHKLARQGEVESMREILDRLAKHEAVKQDLNWQDKQGKTPIFYAVEYGHDKLVKLFLDRGSDVMIENNNGWTVLHTAVNADKEATAALILEHARVEPQKKRLLETIDKSKRTALHIASFKSREGEMVSLLLKHGADSNAQDASGNTGAKLAAKTGRRKSKELLEEHMTAAITAAQSATAAS